MTKLPEIDLVKPKLEKIFSLKHNDSSEEISIRSKNSKNEINNESEEIYIRSPKNNDNLEDLEEAKEVTTKR
jgi:hypothetical protein